MVTVKTYIVPEAGVSIDTSGIVSADVIVVDRNGIGVKHQTDFLADPQEVDVVAYDWYAIASATRPAGTYLLPISVIPSESDQTYRFRVGPTPAEGYTFSIYSGAIVASYLVQSGDTAEDVRDELITAVNNATWPVSVTASAVSTNIIEIVVDDTTTLLTGHVGLSKWKNGYYCVLNSKNYIIFEQQSTTAQPALPAVAASYDFANLTYFPSTIQTYLQEPAVAITFSESVAGQSDIDGAPLPGNVPANECVVYQLEQKIYFNLPLVAGEVINVISK